MPRCGISRLFKILIIFIHLLRKNTIINNSLAKKLHNDAHSTLIIKHIQKSTKLKWLISTEDFKGKSKVLLRILKENQKYH